MTNKSRHK